MVPVGAVALTAAVMVVLGQVADVSNLGEQSPFGPLLSRLDMVGLVVAVVAALAIVAEGRQLHRKTCWRHLAILVGLGWLGLAISLATFRPGAGPGALLAQATLIHPLVQRPPVGFDSAWIFSVLVATWVVTELAMRRTHQRVLPTWVLRFRASSALQRRMLVGALAVLAWHQSVIEILIRQYPERVRPIEVGRGYSGPSLPLVVWALLVTAALAVTTVTVIGVMVRRNGSSLQWFGHPVGLLVGITAAAFVWRVVALLTIAPERTDGGDPLFYHTTANLVANGRGFIEPLNWIAFGRRIASAIHGPLYPLWLAAASRAGGTTYFDHKMMSIVAGTGVVLVAGLIGRRIGGPWTMVAAAGLAGAYPNLWIIDGVLFPEGLFVLCAGLAILAAYTWHDHRRGLTALLMGVAIGLAALTRGEGILMAPLMAAPLIVAARNETWRRRLLALGLVTLGVVGTIAPWTVRNMARFEVFVPLSTNGNELHVYANCDETYSGKFLGFWLFECQERIRRTEGEPPGDEAQRAKYWQDVGFTYAREHASELPKVVAARIGRVWELFRPSQNVEFSAIEGRNTTAQWFGLASYYLLIPFSLVGLVRLRRLRTPLLPLTAQFIIVTLTAAYAYGTIRFRAPAELALCVLAGAGLVPLIRRAHRRIASMPRAANVDPGAFVVGGAVRWRRPRWRSVAAIATVLGFVILPLRGLFRTPGAPMEEGFMLTFPERVMRGDVPNVDFLHLYGPGSLDVLAGLYQLFGVRLEVQRSFGLVQHLAIILGIYALARAWGRRTAVVCALVAVTLVLTPIGLSALAWNGAVAAGLWSVVTGLRASAASRHRLRWAVASGVLAGFALTYRPDAVIALALAHGYLLWRADRPVRLRFAAGAALGVVPMLVHLVVAGPVAAFRGMVLDPVFRLRPGRELPRPPSWTHLDGALQVIAEKFPPWWGLPHLSAPQQLVLWFFALPLIALAIPATGWWLRRQGRSFARARVLLAAGLFGVGLLPQALQRPDSAHFAWVSMVSLPLLPAVGVEILDQARARWHQVTRLAVASGAVAVLMLTVMPFFTFRIYLLHVRQSLGQLPPGLEVERNGRRFYLGDIPPWEASKQLIADLDAQSRPGERLLVGPVDLRQTVYSDVVFYYLFPELTPATYYIEMDPGVANAPDSGLASDVASADWLVLTRFWSGWIEPNDSIVFGPDAPNVVVEQEFCLVGSYQHDLARLYRKCDGGGAPGPYEGPYEPAFDPAVEVRVPVPPRSDGTYPPGSPAAP